MCVMAFHSGQRVESQQVQWHGLTMRDVGRDLRQRFSGEEKRGAGRKARECVMKERCEEEEEEEEYAYMNTSCKMT